MSDAPPEAFGPEEFAAKTGVSRETLARLKAYVGLLEDWNSRHNLVSAKSLADVWRRHVWDSAQLVAHIPPEARTLADLGSGAGFPGLVLAELLRDRVSVVLFEATKKKADFLDAAAARMGLSVRIRNIRIEAERQAPVDVVTARALAPLDKLLGYAQQMADRRTVCLFLKGQSLASELTEARKSWRMKVLQHPSATDPSGVILEVRELRHVHAKPR
ncbi:MAG TPA: 16S rRNA (guanine(527)-N(7))-methyltransferase RsmG [Rhizomicrobium sp.]|jgi:16S rRNA (guanine527-N7)-methyltransferase|nr:16S rRNA (guanine(527)-N(7))-methyltransferase RsmG [Rhizomicrobium sp.]